MIKKIEEQPQEHPLFPGWKKCGAKTRDGNQCKRVGNRKNGRCRLHGGMSPGAPTGNNNALKHGFYSKEMIKRRKEISQLLRNSQSMLLELK